MHKGICICVIQYTYQSIIDGSMASEEEDKEDNVEEGWGNYDVNDSDEDEAEAPLSIEAQRRQQEERKTWAPRRSQAKPRNTQRPLSFSERNQLRRDADNARKKKKKTKPESPILLTATSSSSSSSAPVLVKKPKPSTRGYDDDDSSSSSSSSSSSESDNEEEQGDDDDEDSVKTEEMGGDPLYLVYDDISPKKLWLGKDNTNPYLRSVNAWVKFNEGHILEAINTAQSNRAERIVEVYRTIRCVPLSNVLGSKESYPHLMAPLRTVFVAFAFYDSDAKESDAAITNPDTLRMIQDLPLELAANISLSRAIAMYQTVLVTLIRGQGRFRPRDAFQQVAKYVPKAKYSPQNQVMVSLWDRENTYFFAVDRPRLPGINTRLWQRLEIVYSNGLFDSEWLHAPALLQHIIQLGLLPEKRTKRRDDDAEVDVTGGAWTRFLAKGLYDPRLFLFISEFINDTNKARVVRAAVREAVQGEWIEEPFFDAQRDRHADIFQPYYDVYYDRE